MVSKRVRRTYDLEFKREAESEDQRVKLDEK